MIPCMTNNKNISNTMFTMDDIPDKLIADMMFSMPILDILRMSAVNKRLNELAEWMLSSRLPEGITIGQFKKFITFCMKAYKCESKSDSTTCAMRMYHALHGLPMIGKQRVHTSIMEGFIILWEGSRRGTLKDLLSVSRCDVVPWYIIALCNQIVPDLSYIRECIPDIRMWAPFAKYESENYEEHVMSVMTMDHMEVLSPTDVKECFVPEFLVGSNLEKHVSALLEMSRIHWRSRWPSDCYRMAGVYPIPDRYKSDSRRTQLYFILRALKRLTHIEWVLNTYPGLWVKHKSGLCTLSHTVYMKYDCRDILYCMQTGKDRLAVAPKDYLTGDPVRHTLNQDQHEKFDFNQLLARTNLRRDGDEEDDGEDEYREECEYYYESDDIWPYGEESEREEEEIRYRDEEEFGDY